VSVKGPANADYTHKMQSGGTGEFARVLVHVAPSASLLGIQFCNEDASGNVPGEYVDAVEKGARDAAQMGGPLTATEIRLIGGAYHDTDRRPPHLSGRPAEPSSRQ
jgi:elongation factor G